MLKRKSGKSLKKDEIKQTGKQKIENIRNNNTAQMNFIENEKDNSLTKNVQLEDGIDFTKLHLMVMKKKYKGIRKYRGRRNYQKIKER